MRRIVVSVMVLALILAACTAPPPATPRGVGGANAAEYVLAPSAARTAAFTGDRVDVRGLTVFTIQLDITAASGTSPTLDVKLQTLIDDTNWCDFAAFAQQTAAARRVIRVNVTSAPQAEVACTDGTLAAGTVHQGPLGRAVRVKHGTPGGTTPSFTYSVKAWAGE